MKRMLLKKEKIKKRKGFTLIELLAVILILGIIALIAIPTVNGVIEQSREGAASSSAKQFIKSVEEKAIILELDNSKMADGDYSITSDELQNLELKGTKPDSGFVTIEDNSVVYCNLSYGNYVIICDDERRINKLNNENNNENNNEKNKEKIEVVRLDPNSWTPAENGTYLGMAYYNPTEGKKCSKSDFEANLAKHTNTNLDSNGEKSQHGLKNGCMKWYAYKDNGDGTINMILNHNITNSLSKQFNATKFNDITDDLRTETSGWKVTATLLDLNDILGKLDLLDKNFSLSNQYYLNTNGTASRGVRIIETDSLSEYGYNRFFWLAEYMQDFNSYFTKVHDQNIYGRYRIGGYFTLNLGNAYDVWNAKSDFVWTVGAQFINDEKLVVMAASAGDLIGGIHCSFSPSIGVGIRPVITVSTDTFK